ncbi:hypothetical protein D3C81_1534900 [compost metagenome]
MFTPETKGRIDAQQSLGHRTTAADGTLQFLNLGQDARPFGQVNLAFMRHAHRAGGAIQQAHAKALLEVGQAFGHRRRRHAELARDCRQAALLHQDREKSQIGEIIHY